MITLLLFVRTTYTWVLFFAHIPFVVNRTFNARLTERLQQWQCFRLQIFYHKNYEDLFLLEITH